MSEKLPISVHILTWNSGKTLRRAIESVRTCAEILVIDGGSSDDTLHIAKEYGARVILQPMQHCPIEDFSVVRNLGLKHATQPWILALDSDEYASTELMIDLQHTVSRELPCACFIPRKYVLPDGRIVTHATTYPNERFYFFHRTTVIRWIKPVHERPEIVQGVPLLHLRGASLAPLGTLEDYTMKNLRYVQIEMEKSRGKSLGHWFYHRLLNTLCSRFAASLKLLWILCLPHQNCVRLPLRHEFLRFWYGWKLVVTTCPMKNTLDRYYRYIRPLRPLYGWAKDRVTKAHCNRRAEEWRAKGFRGAKLDICGGRNPWKPGEFLNVDIVPLPQVALMFDIRTRFPIPDGVIAEIFSAATLEHFREQDNLHILREFYRILQPGGLLQISTPDIEAIARGLLAGDDLNLINQHFFGKFKGDITEDYDLHRWMYPASKMIEVLQGIGFVDVKQIPNTTGLHDPKYNYLIRARKP